MKMSKNKRIDETWTRKMINKMREGERWKYKKNYIKGNEKGRWREG